METESRFLSRRERRQLKQHGRQTTSGKSRRQFLGMIGIGALAAGAAGLGLWQLKELTSSAPEEELILDTAQFFCERTRCPSTPEELVRRVSFVDSDTLIREVERANTRKLTQREKDSDRKTRLEITTKEGQIFVQKSLLEKIIANPALYLEHQTIQGIGGGKELERGILESLLIHAFSHAISPKEKYQGFSPFSLRIGNIAVPKIGVMEGFKFIGEREGGGPFYMTGADEAITEFAARNIGRRNGRYISLSESYSNGADLIQRINRKAGIEPNEFLRYQNGELSQEELFQKWGQLKNPNDPDNKAAIMALVTIGLHVQGGLKYGDTVQGIEEWLGVRFVN